MVCSVGCEILTNKKKVRSKPRTVLVSHDVDKCGGIRGGTTV